MQWLRTSPDLQLQIRSWETKNIKTAQPQSQAGTLFNPEHTSKCVADGFDVQMHHFCDATH